MARAVLAERRQELSQNLVSEELAMSRDEQEANIRNQEVESFGGVPVFGCDDQTAELRRSVVRKTDAEHGVVKVAVERARVFLLVDHVEIDVGRVATAELGNDGRRSECFARHAVAQEKDVFATP